MAHARSVTIRRFIVEQIDRHPGDITALVQREYGMTRQAANRHLKALETEGVIAGTGATRSRHWRRTAPRELSRRLRVTPVLTAARLWTEYLARAFDRAPPDTRSAAHFSFGAIASNALRAAGATWIHVDLAADDSGVEVGLYNDGESWFAHGRTMLDIACGPSPDMRAPHSPRADAPPQPTPHAPHSPRADAPPQPTPHAARESDRSSVVRPGDLLVASRLCDAFAIASGSVAWAWDREAETWRALDSLEASIPSHGTRVAFRLSRSATRTPVAVREEFTAPGAGVFSRVHVPMILAAQPGCECRTRAQATALTAHLANRREVLLDFRGVHAIGRGFADELFRVFRAHNPDVTLVTLHATALLRNQIRDAMTRFSAAGTDYFLPSLESSSGLRGTNSSAAELMQ